MRCSFKAKFPIALLVRARLTTRDQMPEAGGVVAMKWEVRGTRGGQSGKWTVESRSEEEIRAIAKKAGIEVVAVTRMLQSPQVPSLTDSSAPQIVHCGNCGAVIG